jgi:hypothetical protein
LSSIEVTSPISEGRAPSCAALTVVALLCLGYHAVRAQPVACTGPARIFFIHMNHTNPALQPGTETSRRIRARGFNVAREGDCFSL